MMTLRLSDQVIKSLSRPELRILQYVYEHTEALLGMSIQKLASEVAYSPATILRFCKKLGYSGFAEFKYALRAERREQAAGQPPREAGGSFSTRMHIDTMRSNLEATAKLVSEEELGRVFAYLDSGCPIYLWSPGGLTSVAVEYFEKLLLSIGRQEVYFIESVKMFEHVLHSRSGASLLILISTSGKHSITIRLGKLAQANGVTVLSITPYTSNEVAAYSDLSFRFFTDQRENRGAEFTSRLPIFFVINTIVQCYLRQKGFLPDGEEPARAGGRDCHAADF